MKLSKTTILLFILFLMFNTSIYSQWTRVRSFTGGNTVSMAIDSNIIYACVAGHGFVKSTDAGDNWSFVNDSVGVYDNFSYLTAEGANILMSTYVSNFLNYSADSGKTWTMLTSPITPGQITMDAKFYRGKIFVTDFGNSLYTSVDAGLNWNTATIINKHKIEISGNNIFLVPNNFGFNGDSILYASRDTGNTWLNLGALHSTSYQSFSVKGDTIAVFSPYEKLQISTDFGANWNTVPCPNAGFYTYPVIYLDQDTLYFINNDSIFNSYNLGVSWNFLAYKGALRAKSVVKAGNDLLIGSFSHAFVRFNTSNNTTVKKAKEIFATDVDDLVVKGDSIMITNEGIYYYSIDNGNTWSYQLPFYSSYNVYRITVYDSTGIYTSLNNKILKSTDWGVTWMPFDTLPEQVTRMFCYDGNIFYGTDHGVYMGFSQGGTIIKYGNLNSRIWAIAACNNKLIASDEDHVYTTTIGPNPQWTISANGLPNDNHFYYIAASDTAVFIGANRGVYRCYPPDTTWTYTGLYHKYIKDLECFHNDAFSVSQLKDVAVLTNDTGSVWNPINFGLDNYQPKQIGIGSDYLFCGERDHGLYRRLRSEIQIPLTIDENNTSTALFSVYPNPASNILSVKGVSSTSNTEIKLIELTGRVIYEKTIFTKGDFTQNIDVHGFSNGIYVLYLKNHNSILAQKVIIDK